MDSLRFLLQPAEDSEGLDSRSSLLAVKMWCERWGGRWRSYWPPRWCRGRSSTSPWSCTWWDTLRDRLHSTRSTQTSPSQSWLLLDCFPGDCPGYQNIGRESRYLHLHISRGPAWVWSEEERAPALNVQYREEAETGECMLGCHCQLSQKRTGIWIF